jgi:hypothetical protein
VSGLLGIRACRVAAIAAASLALVAAPASATTMTFGADLSLTPDLSFHCPLPPPFFGPYLRPDTCTALTSGVFGGGNTLASHLVPEGSGVITKLRLREPNIVSSPLKMTVLQGLRAPQSTVPACCTVVSESPPFTPLPNQITEITFNPPIPVHDITTVTGVYEFQAVALTATDANSVIPAATAPGHASGAYYPAALPGQERDEDMTSLGTDTQILFQVDEEMTADPTNGVGTAPTQTPASPFAVQPLLLGGTPQFAGNTASIPLFCELTTACTGTLKLQNVAPNTARATAAKTSAPKVYGTTRFTIKAGKKGTIKVKLNAAGRKLFAHRKSVTVYGTAKLSGGQVVGAKLKLTRTSSHHS